MHGRKEHIAARTTMAEQEEYGLLTASYALTRGEMMLAQKIASAVVKNKTVIKHIRL
jgi:hypothetical protein